MAVLTTSLDTRSAAFQTSAEQWRALAADLREKRAEAAQGGPAKARERHLARGKLLPRDRVTRLLDPGSPFLEIGALARTACMTTPSTARA